MSMSDPIADMLTRIRNASRAGHADVLIPFSNLKAQMARLLVESGYLEKVEEEGEKPKVQLRLTLKYYEKKPVIEGVRRVSRPSRRVYVAVKEIPRFRGGLGTVVLSTPQGIVTGKQAKKLNVGGEVLCYVW